MKTKMTVIMLAGQRQAIEIEHPEANMTDEDVFHDILAMWMHGVSCKADTHLLRFRCYPGGELMAVLPDAVAGLTLKVEVLN